VRHLEGRVAIRKAAAVRGERKRLFTDLVWTAVTQVAVLAGNALIAALLARRAVELFGSYNLARRVAASALPVVSLGLTLGLARQLAAASVESRRSYISAGAMMLAVSGCVGSVTIVLGGEGLSSLLLGEANPPMLWAVWVYTLGLAASSLAYATFRGLILQSSANMTSVVGFVAVPLGVVLIAGEHVSPEVLIGTVGGAMCLWGAIQLLRVWVDTRGAPVQALRHRIRDLTSFSAPRVPGAVAQGLIMTTGPLLAQRSGHVLAASYLLAALAFAQLGAAAMQAFSTVLLPRVSEMHASGDRAGISRLSSGFIYVMSTFCLVGIPIGVGAAGAVTRVWLGPEFEPAVLAIRIVLLSIPFYVAYNVLTSVTDATVRAPVSTYAAISGFGVTMAATLIMGTTSPAKMSLSFLMGQVVAGAWVFGVVVHRHRPKIRARRFGLVAVFGAVACVVLLAIARTDVPDVYQVVLALATGAGGLALAVYSAPPETGLPERLSRLRSARNA